MDCFVLQSYPIRGQTLDNFVADLIIVRKLSSFNIYSFNKHLARLNATLSSNATKNKRNGGFLVNRYNWNVSTSFALQCMP